MAEKELVFVVKGKDEASGPFGKVKKSLDAMNKSGGGLRGTLGQAGGAVLGFAKIAAAAAIGGIGLLAGALVLAAKAGIEEEANIAKLDAALRANIPAWDGNRSAIEQVIETRQGLAFADDALRDSLGTLVVATKDVSAALDLQTLAMDFARLKGIDLTTASEIVGKVYAGNTGILGRYGIQLEKGATATEALAAIQRASAGQAEAYGNTTKGAFEKFQIAVANVVEDVGAALLPKLADLATFLRETVIPRVKEVIAKVEAWVKANSPFIEQVRELVNSLLAPFKTGLEAIVKVFTDFGPLPAIITGVTIAVFALSAAVRANPIVAIAAAIILVIGLLVEAWDRDFGGMRTTILKFFDAIKPITDAIATGFRIAGNAVGWLLGRLQELGTWVSNNINTLRDLASFLPFVGPAIQAGNLSNSLQGRAHGGPVSAGRPYLVGERGPELMVPRTSGTIVPNSGSGGLNVYGVTINGSSGDPRKMADDFFREVQRRMTQQNITALQRR